MTLESFSDRLHRRAIFVTMAPDDLAPDHDSDQPTTTIIDLHTARIRRRPVLGGIASEYHIAA